MRKFTQLGIAVLLGASVAAAAPILTITNVTAGDNGTTINTAIGDFSVTGSPGTGSCRTAGGTAGVCDALQILNTATSPFNGRFNTTAGGANWLDSNDIDGVALTINLVPALNNIFFFITDVQDQGGTLTITADDGTQTTANFGGGLPNGQVFMVRATAMGGATLSGITFSNTSTGDGFGVDDFGTTVPEPSSMLLLGTALLGLGWMRSRRAKS